MNAVNKKYDVFECDDCKTEHHALKGEKPSTCFNDECPKGQWATFTKITEKIRTSIKRIEPSTIQEKKPQLYLADTQLGTQAVMGKKHLKRGKPTSHRTESSFREKDDNENLFGAFDEAQTQKQTTPLEDPVSPSDKIKTRNILK